jgi:hypothetical protein
MQTLNAPGGGEINAIISAMRLYLVLNSSSCSNAWINGVKTALVCDCSRHQNKIWVQLPEMRNIQKRANCAAYIIWLGGVAVEVVDEPLLTQRLVHIDSEESGERDKVPHCKGWGERAIGCWYARPSHAEVAGRRRGEEGGQLADDKFVVGSEGRVGTLGGGLEEKKITGKEGGVEERRAAVLRSQIHVVFFRAGCDYVGRSALVRVFPNRAACSAQGYSWFSVHKITR